MKRNLLTLFFIATALITSAQTNLVSNGDFEEWDFLSGNPVSWSRHAAAAVSKSTDAQSGTYSAEMEADDFSNGVAFVETTEKMPLKAGETYNCSSYYKIVTGTLSKFEVTLMYTPSFFPEYIVTKPITEQTPNVWHKYEFSYTETEDREVDLQILFWTDDEVATVLIDNVSLVNANATSIGNVEASSLAVYPNPASDYVVVDGNADAVEFYSTTGQLIKQTNEAGRIDISSLPTGTYIVKILEKGKTATSKLIKK